MSNYNSDHHSSCGSTPDEEYNNNNDDINGENVSYASTNSELLPSTSADTSSEIQRPKSLTSEEIEDAKKGEQLLGLKLTFTPSFLDLCNRIVSETDDSFFKVNFSALSLTIGSWTKIARHGGELIVKCYFKEMQLVWKVLNGNLKNKIEFLWSNIAAIKATFHPNEGVLDIMLEKPPLFFQEVTPERRNLIKWDQCGDFTGQQASIIRKHRLVFRPGVLEEHYNKIILSDLKLYSMSEQPFPYHASMYFNEIPSVMNFSGHSMSNSPSNITTVRGYNPGYHGLSSTNNEQPNYTNDQSQFSLMSSANLGTTHQQAGYVHSSSVHAATMENNTGQDPLGYQNSMQQMTQPGDNTLDHSSHDAGVNQNQN